MSGSRPNARRPRRYGRPRAQEVDRRVAHRIHERRLGLTTREVADRHGLSLEQVRRIEAGVQMVTPGQLHAIAEVLGMDIADLFTGAGPGGGGEVSTEHPAFVQLLADFAALHQNHRKALLNLCKALSGRAGARDSAA